MLAKTNLILGNRNPVQEDNESKFHSKCTVQLEPQNESLRDTNWIFEKLKNRNQWTLNTCIGTSLKLATDTQKAN